MKAIRFLLICTFACAFAVVSFAQQGNTGNSGTGSSTGGVGAMTGMGNTAYQLGPGDILEIKVLGEEDLNEVDSYEVNGDGFIEFATGDLIPARCRTDREVKADVVKALKTIIRNPQVVVRVKERNSRPPAVIIGAVKDPQRLIFFRRVRLLELLSYAGGANEGEAGGSIQIFRTTPILCPAKDEEELAKIEIGEDGNVPSTTYNLRDSAQGKTEGNPYIYPGDIVLVHRAPPVYIVGRVNNPQGIYWRENMTLTNALAMVNGVSKDAKTDKIYIRRQKQGTTDRELITINFKDIQKGKQKDIVLQAYDIVEVDEAGAFTGKNLLRTLLGGGLQSLTSGVGMLPTRVLY